LFIIVLGSPRKFIFLNVSSRFGEKYVNVVAVHGLVARPTAMLGSCNWLRIIRFNDYISNLVCFYTIIHNLCGLPVVGYKYICDLHSVSTFTIMQFPLIRVLDGCWSLRLLCLAFIISNNFYIIQSGEPNMKH